MDIVVDATGVRIVEPETLTSFAVVSSLPLADIDAALRAADLGHVQDGHAWVSADVLESRAAALVSTPDWAAKYRDMVDFAAAHGWWDAERARIRAHIQSI
jgi:hypothetical protein